MIIPAQDYILLTVEKKEEVTKSGIYLPDKTADTPQCGTVAQATEGFTKGMKVWFKRWAGEEIEYEGVKYLLVHVKDILAYESK